MVVVVVVVVDVVVVVVVVVVAVVVVTYVVVFVVVVVLVTVVGARGCTKFTHRRKIDGQKRKRRFHPSRTSEITFLSLSLLARACQPFNRTNET